MPLPAPVVPEEIPITPTVEVWRAMTQAERDAHVQAVFAALEQEQIRAGEGTRHFKTKAGAWATLSDHFQRVEKRLFLACELSTLYPGEPAFCPDLLAVLEAESPEEDRSCWVVADEGRGLDFVLEVVVHGDRQKDLVRNVAWYARLGIPEYFVYDRGANKVYGFRLNGAVYRSLPARHGLIFSNILGLSLGVLEGRLRFFSGEAQIPETAEILERLDRLVEQREREISEAEQRLAEQTAAREEAERLREEAERSREVAERQRQDAEQRLAQQTAARQEADARAKQEAETRAALELELAALRAQLAARG